MLCENCEEAEAIIHHVLVKNNQVIHHHLCEPCAAKLKGSKLEESSPVSKALSTISEIASEDSGECPGCESKLEDFLKAGRLGCSECYTTFEDDISRIIKRIHSNDQHSGRTSAGIKPDEIPGNRKLQLLEKELEQAVKLEDYEKAAELRDQIQKVEKDG